MRYFSLDRAAVMPLWLANILFCRWSQLSMLSMIISLREWRKCTASLASDTQRSMQLLRARQVKWAENSKSCELVPTEAHREG